MRVAFEHHRTAEPLIPKRRCACARERFLVELLLSQARVPEDGLPPAPALCGVQGRVGVDEHAAGGGTAQHPDAGTRADRRVPAAVAAVGDRGDQSSADGEGVGVAGDAVHEHGELVAAEPAGGHARIGIADALRELLDEHVAKDMPHGVVDGFET